MPNLNAALLVAQLENLDMYLENKRELSEKYKAFFETQAFDFVQEPKDSQSNHWLHAVILKDREQRNTFLEFTNAKGVMTRPIWTLMNKLDMFKDAQCSDLTNSQWLEDRVVNIPSSVRV